MKQRITKEQWNEADNKESLFVYFNGTDVHKIEKDDWVRLNIGQMIKYLGDDIMMIEPCLEIGWTIDTYWDCSCGESFKSFKSKELADALWEAVKYKLNK